MSDQTTNFKSVTRKSKVKPINLLSNWSTATPTQIAVATVVEPKKRKLKSQEEPFESSNNNSNNKIQKTDTQNINEEDEEFRTIASLMSLQNESKASEPNEIVQQRIEANAHLLNQFKSKDALKAILCSFCKVVPMDSPTCIIQCPKGHIVCNQCYIARKNKKQHFCFCGVVYPIQPINCQLAVDIRNAQEVSCPLDCDELKEKTLTFSNLVQHLLSDCNNRKSNCPYKCFGCNTQAAMWKDIEIHATQSCLFRPSLLSPKEFEKKMCKFSTLVEENREASFWKNALKTNCNFANLQGNHLDSVLISLTDFSLRENENVFTTTSRNTLRLGKYEFIFSMKWTFHLSSGSASAGFLFQETNKRKLKTLDTLSKLPFLLFWQTQTSDIHKVTRNEIKGQQVDSNITFIARNDDIMRSDGPLKFVYETLLEATNNFQNVKDMKETQKNLLKNLLLVTVVLKEDLE